MKLKNIIKEYIRALDVGYYRFKSIYKTKHLGLSWIPLSMLILIVFVSFLWSNLLEKEFFFYFNQIANGFIIWFLIIGSISSSSDSMEAHRELIYSSKNPIYFYSFLAITPIIFRFLYHSIIIILIQFFLMQMNLSLFCLLVLGLCLVLLNLILISNILSILGARFKDLGQMIQSITPLLLFVTPVLYSAKDLGSYSFIINLNPLTFLIEIVRMPLQGEYTRPLYIFIAILMSLILLIMNYCLYKKLKNKIILWI